jgi:hypothetical protein
MSEAGTEFECEFDEAIAGLGLDTCIADKSGLDERGTGGGGTLALCSWLGVTGLAGFCGLGRPKDRADRLAVSVVVAVGTGATKRGSTFGTGGIDWVRSWGSRVDEGLRDGKRGGSAGIGGLSSFDCAEATDFKDVVDGALFTYLGCSDEYVRGAALLRGGRTGSATSPQAGAFTRDESLDFVLVAINLWPPLPAEPEPLPEFDESSEPLLPVS